MKDICRTILMVSCSSSFTACSIDMDPYVLPYKHGSMPIGHSVKDFISNQLWRVSILHLCIVSSPLPPRGILDDGNTPDHHWKRKTEKFLALCFDKMWHWFQDEAGAFLVILMPAAQMIVWVDWNHKLSHLFQPGQIKREASGNNQQLLLKLSTDVSSSVKVEEYLSVSSSR